MPAIDVMLMIDPPRPRSTIFRAARWLATITPNRSTASTRSKSRRSAFAQGRDAAGGLGLVGGSHVGPLERRGLTELVRQWGARVFVDVGDDDAAAFLDE